MFLPLAVGALLIGGLLARAAATHSPDPLLAAAVMIGAAAVGGFVAPDAPGARQIRTGTGWAGTQDDRDAYWAGPVTCEWTKGVDSAVQVVSGFEVVVDDPAVLAASGVRSATIWSIDLPPEGGWVGVEDSYAVLVNAVVERKPGAEWPSWTATLAEATASASTGTAAVKETGIVLGWECTTGP